MMNVGEMFVIVRARQMTMTVAAEHHDGITLMMHVDGIDRVGVNEFCVGVEVVMSGSRHDHDANERDRKGNEQSPA